MALLFYYVVNGRKQMSISNLILRLSLLRVGIVVGVVFLFVLFIRLNPQLLSYNGWTDEVAYIVDDDADLDISPEIVVEYLTGEDPLITPYGTIEEVEKNCPIRNVTKCLQFLRQTPPRRLLNDNETLIIHTAWRGKISPMHQFLLYSFVATQNLSRTILIYWIDQATFASSMNSSLLAPFLKHSNIVFKCYNITDLASGTPLDPAIDHGENKDHIMKLLNVLYGPLSGDLFRMLILCKYGGIYVDVDVMFLRSFEPLMANEFAYTWSGFASLNTAVLGLKARGHVINELFDYIVTQKKDNFHPHKLMEAVMNRTLPLIIYPSTFFDPVWAISDRFSPLDDNPYAKFPGLFNQANLTRTSFWGGAYANHFHNMYEATNWTADSWAGVVERKWKDKFMRMPRKNQIKFWRKENDELLISECK